jgi:hypothetical protein
MDIHHPGQPEVSSMYRYPIAYVTLCLLAHMVAAAPVKMAEDTPGDRRENTVCLSGAGSPEELAGRLAKLLSASTRSELQRLVSVPDRTAAMAAAWERVRRTMPETEQVDVVTPDLLAVSRFLGLIEGRVGVPVPKAWEETVKSAVGRSQRNIWFPPRWDLALIGRSSGQWPLERDGAHWLVKKDSQSITLPAQDQVETFSDATVECAGESAYVGLYGSLPTSAYRLFAVNQGSGNVVWSCNVWGTSRIRPRGVIVNTSGSDWHVANMRASGETLVVFGFSSRAVYLEAFDRKTGENRCRFSTAYFDFDASAAPK